MRRRRVLVACEETQRVTLAFRARGHDAYSCDRRPTSGPHPEWHLQQDVVPLLREPWDIIIAFPPCTHLAVSGALHFETKRADGRQRRAVEFFMACYHGNATKVAVENPVGIMSSAYREPDQIVQPWMFGDPYQKTTCLWLRGLPTLLPTKLVAPGEFQVTKAGKKMATWMYRDTDGKGADERARIRSQTFPGLARAMADQWGGYVSMVDAL